MKLLTIKRQLLGIALFLFMPSMHAAELTGYYMITDSVIMLHFDDGYIDYHGLGEAAWHHDKPYISKIDLDLAMQPSSYSITSQDDSNYSTSLSPVNINRKSKGGDFSPVNNTVIIHEHFIYLKLPHPLQPRKSYSIDLGELAANQETIEILYEPQNMYSPTVHTNIIAYSTLSNLKFGYVYQWLGDGGSLNLNGYENNNFYLLNASTGDTAFTGKMTLRKDIETGEPDTYNNNDSPYYTMADVYQCDFSSFNQAGEYKLYVENIGCSHPFEIKEDAYREAFRQTAWGLYHQRSGPERSMPESPWPKGTDHMPGVNGFSIEYSEWRIMDGSNAFEELPAHATGEVFPTNPGEWMPKDPEDWGWGGYFDAGDFDRRHVHMSVSEHLLFAYELKPENFIDNELRIPENNNGIPDIIDEARWAIDMHRRLQGPTGGICGGMEENEHPKPGENSVTDSRPWYVYAEEPQASYHLAAANAQLAWCFALAGDMSENDSLISQAERVYKWAAENMREGDEDKVDEYRMRAAAWLFRYTGKEEYHRQFLNDYKNGVKDEFAFYSYMLNRHPDVNATIQNELKFDMYALANKRLEAGKKRAERWANFDMNGFHRVGGASTPYIFPLVFTYGFTGIQEYLDYAYTTADYFMGGNPINKVYVTGLGESHTETLLHLDSWFDGVDPMVPGIVPYGLHTYGKWMDSGSGNVYQPLGNFESCYPSWQEWPSHEIWFENRYLIIQNEFTVQQTQGPATAAYAYLSAPIHPEGIAVEAVSINYDSLNLFTGTTFRLIASVSPYDAANKNLTWSSGDESIIKVNDGVIDILKEGKTYVYIESEDGGYRDSCLVSAVDYVELTGINIIEEDLELTEGQTDTLHVEIIPENATYGNFSISVEDTAIASINDDLILAAKKPGATIIRAVSNAGELSDEMNLTVLKDRTGREKYTGQQDLWIWPNPCTGFFFVESPDPFTSILNVKINSPDGRVLINKEYNTSGQKKITINCNKLPAGIYFVNISQKDGAGYQEKKIIVRH